MPLTSLTLRNNQALQDCLVRDASHVTRGARGPHVRLIQKCLIVIDSSSIDTDELRNALYGPSTAAAVLSYKKNRSIINFSYEQAADDIVGKMTIARLDDDIKKFETARMDIVRCEHGRGGHIRPHFAESVSAVRGNAGVTGAPTKNPVTNHSLLSVHVQFTDSLERETAGVFVNNLFARARALLRPWGMTLTEPTLFPSAPIPWPEGELATQLIPDIIALRKSAVAMQPGSTDVLRVVFCPFGEIDKLKGITSGGLDALDAGQKFCMINLKPNHRNPDGGTLLHEMIHAAFPGRSPFHDGDPKSLYSEAEDRTQVRQEHAELLARSFFARKLR